MPDDIDLQKICFENKQYSLGPVYEFVCISFSTGNLNCFRVK